MSSFSPLRRVYLAYLSRVYALMYTLSRRSVLGFRLATLARWLPILLLLIGWSRRWPAWSLVVLLLFALWINFSLWRARRDHHIRFVPEGEALLDATNLSPLPPNHKIAVRATGLFSVSGHEDHLLLRPAQYWRVPLGEHVVMAEERPGKYLYQFFNAASLQAIQPGLLLFGRNPTESLAVTFLASWGPDYTKFGQIYEDGDNSGLPPPRRVTVYLSAADEAQRRAIWHTIVADARQSRLDAG
jgi:hypothetical protein